MSADDSTLRCRGGDKITSRLRDHEAYFFLEPADETIRAGGDSDLDDLRLLMLTGYNPKEAHLPWDILVGLIGVGLAQLSSTDMATRADSLRMTSAILSGTIGLTRDLIDEADPLLELRLLAVQAACLCVADELPRTSAVDGSS